MLTNNSNIDIGSYDDYFYPNTSPTTPITTPCRCNNVYTNLTYTIPLASLKLRVESTIVYKKVKELLDKIGCEVRIVCDEYNKTILLVIEHMKSNVILQEYKNDALTDKVDIIEGILLDFLCTYAYRDLIHELEIANYDETPQ